VPGVVQWPVDWRMQSTHTYLRLYIGWMWPSRTQICLMYAVMVAVAYLLPPAIRPVDCVQDQNKVYLNWYTNVRDDVCFVWCRNTRCHTRGLICVHWNVAASMVYTCRADLSEQSRIDWTLCWRRPPYDRSNALTSRWRQFRTWRNVGLTINNGWHTFLTHNASNDAV